MIIEEADLRNVSVVDRPAYRGSRVDQRSKQEGDVMDESTVTALIEDALKKRGDDDKLDTGALVLAITEAVNAERPETDVALREQIDSALLERDEARAAEAKAADDAKVAEAKAAEERSKLEDDAERKADLRVTFADLFPSGFEARGKSAQEMLVAAVGKSVDKPETRSEDYLLAKAEEILKARETAGPTTSRSEPKPGTDPNRKYASNGWSRPGNITRMVMERKRSTAA